VASLTSSAALAGPPTDTLRPHITNILALVQDPELAKATRTAERRRRIRDVAHEVFAFEESARHALGRHWTTLTPAEQGEFVRLYAGLLERSYFSKIELYGGERIKYLDDRVDGTQALVRTQISTKTGSEVAINYRMIQKSNQRWYVFDVIIEGVSLVSNYRTQFNKIIQNSSYEQLVLKLRRQEALQSQAIH
jgi:phospholipid transport system substrate-binding protein